MFSFETFYFEVTLNLGRNSVELCSRTSSLHLPWLAYRTTDLPHQASHITPVVPRVGIHVGTAALLRCTHLSLLSFAFYNWIQAPSWDSVSQFLSLLVSVTRIGWPFFHGLGAFELRWPVVLHSGFGFRLDCGCRIWKESQKWHAVCIRLHSARL